MSLISFLDLLSIIFLAYAAWTVFLPEIRQAKLFNPLILLVVLFAVNAIPNFLEWLGYEAQVEPFEEYIQILVPAAFFLVFAFAKFEEREEIIRSRNRVLTAIHTVTEKPPTDLKPPELWKDLLSRVVGVMGFDGGFIDFSADQQLAGIRVKWNGWDHFSEQLDLLKVEGSILSQVTMKNSPMMVEQTDNIPDPLIQALNVSGIQSVGLFPVSSGSMVLGVMGIVSHPRHSFTLEETDLFSMLGHHLGETIHNDLLISGTRGQAEDLRQAAEARRHFLALISSDLREPLMRIRTVLQRLQDEVGSWGRDNFGKILDEAHRDSANLERLIDDVRELAILDSGHYELAIIPQDLMKELGRLVSQYQVKAEDKGVDLTLKHNSHLGPLEADRSLLYSAMKHLLSNAVKYTPRNGEVVVEAWEDGNFTSIQVSDTGIGIDEDLSERVFDMFYRAGTARDQEKEGTGLGLTIVNRIVQLHNGNITFGPRAGGGTVFTVTLPRMHLEE